MDILAVLALVNKGITVAQALIEAGKSAAPALEAIKNLVSTEGEITDEQLDAVEDILDAQIEEFNLDIEG